MGGCRAGTWGGLATCTIDLAGNDVAGVPENAFVGEISYIGPLANTGIDWFIATNSRFQDERFINASNTASVSDYWISDLRLGVTTDRWDVIFYVDNVFDNNITRGGPSGVPRRRSTSPSRSKSAAQAPV